MTDVKVFTPDELSNEEYHKLPQISGSSLTVIYFKCPAAWRYGERNETDALIFGTAAHTVILESEKFDSEYACGFNESKYPHALKTATDVKKWLEVHGIKKTGSKEELIERALNAEPGLQIIDVLKKQHEQASSGKKILKHSDYEILLKMREQLFSSREVSEMLDGSFNELSFISDESDIKTRPDVITKAGGICNYKTTTDCTGRRFSSQAHDNGYLLKAALEFDMFELTYGRKPAFYSLLAQEKKPPFLFKNYLLTNKQLAIGRHQYSTALKVYQRCLQDDTWPGYGETEELELSPFIENMYFL